jgi:hypothetical protein
MGTDWGSREEGHDETDLREEQLNVAREQCHNIANVRDRLILDFQHVVPEREAAEEEFDDDEQ